MGYPYKVSVSIITYNQVDCIENAIESALKQQVEFPYEIIIGDDYSTDGTREVLLDYRERYPELIKLNLHDTHYEGIAGRLNNITNIRSAKGKYIAFCDGDDYWISEDKLQKQAELMDAHPEYAYCFHDAWYIFEGVREKKFSDQFYHLHASRDFDIHDLAQKKMQVPSGSVFMRSTYLDNLPDWFWEVYRADHALQLMAAEHGNIRYMDDLLSGYHVHQRGMSQLFSKELTALKMYKNDIDLFRRHIDIDPGNFMDARAEYYIELASQAFRDNNLFKAAGFLTRCLFTDPRSLNYLSSLLYAKVRRAIM